MLVVRTLSFFLGLRCHFPHLNPPQLSWWQVRQSFSFTKDAIIICESQRSGVECLYFPGAPESPSPDWFISNPLLWRPNVLKCAFIDITFTERSVLLMRNTWMVWVLIIVGPHRKITPPTLLISYITVISIMHGGGAACSPATIYMLCIMYVA